MPSTCASRRQLHPGKTMTLAFMTSVGASWASCFETPPLAAPQHEESTPHPEERRSRVSKGEAPDLSRLELIGVVLDDGVGEELLAHALHFGAGAFRIALGHLDLDIFTLAHIANRAEAERMERAGDRLALRVEHARLQRDGDARLHAPVFRLRPIWSAPAP